jgi:hypothetical protein
MKTIRPKSFKPDKNTKNRPCFYAYTVKSVVFIYCPRLATVDVFGQVELTFDRSGFPWFSFHFFLRSHPAKTRDL